MKSIFDELFSGLAEARQSFEPTLTPREVRVITSVATGIAKCPACQVWAMRYA